MLLAFFVLIAASLACGSSTSTTSSFGEGDTSRCITASSAQVEAIRAGVKDIADTNDIKSGWAVKSNDFDNVWFVAAKIYGPGIENGSDPGVWAISGDLNNPGMILSVNGYAKEFSSYPDASKTDASITTADDGAKDALLCASK